MGAKRGRDLVLSLDPDGTGFVTVAGMRARRLALNARSVDATDFESAGRWRELLEGAGVRSAAISGSGIFKDKASDEAVRNAFFAGRHARWRVTVPDFGTIEAPFQVTALEYGAPHDREVTFEIALESAGAVTWTAHPCASCRDGSTPGSWASSMSTSMPTAT